MSDERLLEQGLVGPIRPSQAPLRKRYGMPPFSVLNTREGPWQRRKRAWIGLGIQSEVGRCDNLMDISATQAGLMGYIDAGDPAAVEDWNRKRREMREQTGRLSDESKQPQKRTIGKTYNDHERIKEHAYDTKNPPNKGSGTSIFDPVLTELCYSWFCPPAGIIVDPFAGGSVRGIVASVLGYKYWGCELRPEQVAANREQRNESTTGKYKPKWGAGDSFDRLPEAPLADFIFTCPPYGDLEQYSDMPADLSAMKYPQFLKRYTEIIGRACERLKHDRFACFCVANFRDRKSGRMRDFVGDTIRAFESFGLMFYNDIVLINAVGTAAIRAENNFKRGGRKVVKLHQNVLVFVKGDPKKATLEIEAE